jgi:hypothetical protein
MPFMSSLERLTWRNQGPAPFESASNVFLKVMSLNWLTFSELCALIQREGTMPHCLPWAFTYGNWVDFLRYSSLLRVDQSRLKDGFLDWLGFDSPKGASIGIRHCPECLGLNYHCSLFNLAILTECPWHGCPLRERCYTCAMRLELMHEWDARPCCRCGNDWRYLYECPDVNRVPSELANQIDSYCRRLVGWWAYVRQNAHGDFPLLSPIIELFSARREFNEQRDLAFYLAEKIAPFPVPWRHSVRPTAARIVRLERSGKVEFTPEHRKERMQEFRSVRRHIFKRFVKSHHRCLREILSMNGAERGCLDSSVFCSVCVAYVAWLGSAAVTREAWGQPKSKERAGEPAEFARFSSSNDWGNFAEQAFLAFITAWAKIERIVSRSNLYVYAHATSRAFGKPKWTVDGPHTFFEGDYNCETSSAIFLLTDEVELADRARRRCERRVAHGYAMTVIANYYMPDGVDFDGASAIFKIKDYSHHLPNSYNSVSI